MKIMIDLNVLLDVVQKRTPDYYASSAVLSKVLNHEVSGFLPGHALTTIYYLVSRYSNKRRADEVIDWMLMHFEVVSADKPVFARSRGLKMNDFEDAVVASLAESAGCDYIVTRNVSDFKSSPIIALTPEEFLDSN
jgi:predicted nucleic acid-binding protein